MAQIAPTRECDAGWQRGLQVQKDWPGFRDQDVSPVKISVYVAGNVETVHEFSDGDEHRVVFTAGAAVRFFEAILQGRALDKARCHDSVSV